MSYPQSGGLLNFFAPLIPLATTDSGVLQEIDIGAASADHGELVCHTPCTMKRAQFSLTSEAASGTTTAPTVIFTKRPTPLSATSESVAATVTVASGGAVGATYYTEVDVDFAVGDTLEISHTVGVGTPTGIGVASAEFSYDPEVPGNNSEMILSST